MLRLLTLLATLVPTVIHAETDPDRVAVELSTFVAHCDPESRGISCVIVNNTQHAINAWKGYDGERNKLVSGNSPFPIELHPEQKPELQSVRIEPGMRETIFSLSLDAIFFLQPTEEREGWRWRWGEPAPRGAPPKSPFHGSGELGWEVRRTDTGMVTAEVEVDGQPVASEPLKIRAEKPRTEVVKALVRFRTARVIDSDQRRRYEFTLDVRKAIEGVLAEEERTMTIDCRFAEPMMKDAGVRRDVARESYLFAGPPMTLTFARVLPAGLRPGGLVLMSCESTPGAEAAGPLNLAAPDGTVLIAAADLVSYEWRSHTIRLRPGVLALLQDKLQAELARGVIFEVRVGDTPLYPGVFTTGVSSISQSLPVVLLDGDDALPIQLGYPDRDQFLGDDPRADKRLKAALRESGLLDE